MSGHRLRSLALIVVLVLVTLSSAMVLPTAAQDDEADADEVVNVELIVDVSGSMAQTLATGETRVEAAQRVLADVIAGIPEQEGVNVGLRIYGHEGDNTEAGQAVRTAARKPWLIRLTLRTLPRRGP